MKLRIRQRIFSWTDSYDIYDEWGSPKYEVRADFLALGHHIHVYEKSSGREIGAIHEKLLRFLPTFEIEVDGRICGSVRKEFSFLLPRYSIDCLGWEVRGNFLGWDYEVLYRGKRVACIQKEVLNFSDTYTVNYEDPADELPALLLVLAIDAANCSKND